MSSEHDTSKEKETTGKAPQPALTLSRPAASTRQDKTRKTGVVPIGTSGTLFVVHN